jgi:hypothetical protein
MFFFASMCLAGFLMRSGEWLEEIQGPACDPNMVPRQAMGKKCGHKWMECMERMERLTHISYSSKKENTSFWAQGISVWRSGAEDVQFGREIRKTYGNEKRKDPLSRWNENEWEGAGPQTERAEKIPYTLFISSISDIFVNMIFLPI